MDNQNWNQVDRHSSGMANAALALGILALLSSPCIFTGIVMGGLAIILGVLSRGGQMKYSTQAILGIVLGALGILCVIGMVVFSLAVILQQYGSFEAYLQEYIVYLEMAGFDTSMFQSSGF